MRQRDHVTSLFSFLAITLSVLPVLLTVNDILMKVVEQFYLYPLLERSVVPVETRLLQLPLEVFAVHATAYQNGLLVQGRQLVISWNCLGWQSVVLFLCSLLVALRNRPYTLVSLLQVVLFGLFGVFWVNLLRMLTIVLLSLFSPPFYQFIFHDVLAALVTIIYLFFFWWFAYQYILVEKLPIGTISL